MSALDGGGPFFPEGTVSTAEEIRQVALPRSRRPLWGERARSVVYLLLVLPWVLVAALPEGFMLGESKE